VRFARLHGLPVSPVPLLDPARSAAQIARSSRTPLKCAAVAPGFRPRLGPRRCPTAPSAPNSPTLRLRSTSRVPTLDRSRFLNRTVCWGQKKGQRGHNAGHPEQGVPSGACLNDHMPAFVERRPGLERSRSEGREAFLNRNSPTKGRDETRQKLPLA
jgi:hypothetical protein